MSITTRKGKNKTTYQVKVRGVDHFWVTETFATKTAAREFETNAKNQILSGSKTCNNSNKLLIKDYWIKWCKTTTLKVSPGWHLKQKQKYRDYIQPNISELKLNDITAAHISLILTKMKNKGLSAQMQLHVYNLLRKMFEDSVELFEYRSKNPVKKSLRPKVTVKETSHLNYHDSIKLLSYVKDKPYGIAIWIQVLAGLRACEILYLRWNEHIDFENHKIKVRGTWRRSENKFVPHPKGKRWFEVKIAPELLEFLKAERLKTTGKYLITSLKGQTEYASFHSYYNILKRYCKEAGVSTNIGTHGLRHSTSGIYMHHGASEEDMQALFDHSSPNTTARYIHGRHKKKKNVEKIAEEIRLF